MIYNLVFKIIDKVPVHCVQHFNSYKYRQCHCHGVRVCEYFTVYAFEFITASNASQVMSLKK